MKGRREGGRKERGRGLMKGRREGVREGYIPREKEREGEGANEG